MRYLNYIFLFFSILAFLSFYMLGIFGEINLIIVILYFNSVILISDKNLNFVLKNLLFGISIIIFIYLIYLIYIHSNLGDINNQFSVWFFNFKTMIQILKHIPLLISGVIAGIILYQSLMIAPSINKLLSTQDASLYLRFIWPKFFLIIALISLICGLILIYFNPDQNTAKIFSFVSFLLMVVCYLMIPFMNESKDSGNDTLFIILHAGSMILTLITLIINILLIVFWKY